MNPSLTNVNVASSDALGMLAGLVSDPGHRYLDGGPAPVEVPEAFAAVMGHRQVTDAYLVRFAAHHGARFVTFDAKLRNLPGVLLLK